MPKVNPQILRWARETAGLSLKSAAEKLGIESARGATGEAQLTALENGETEPSRSLLPKMAQHYPRPLIAFSMSAPPRRGDRGEDFRNLPDRHTVAETLVDALVRDVRARQAMVRDVLLDDEEAEPLPFIGSMTMRDGVGAVLASPPNRRARSRGVSGSIVNRNRLRAATVKGRSGRDLCPADGQSRESSHCY